MADNMFDLIEEPIDIFAKAETIQAIKDHIFNWTIWPDFSKLPDEKHPLLRFNVMEQGLSKDLLNCQITAFPVEHTVPAFGYVVKSERYTFAFSGDTNACDSLWDTLNALPALDKLMIEIAFTNEQEELANLSRHFTPKLLGEQLKRLKHKPQILLTHHKPGCEAVIEKQTREALAGWHYHHLRRGDIIY